MWINYPRVLLSADKSGTKSMTWSIIVQTASDTLPKAWHHSWSLSASVRRFTSQKLTEFGVTPNDCHLPWELHLERSCRETAGPAGAHQSPPARHRHSRPHRCCSHTAPSAPPRPAPTAAPVSPSVTHSTTPWTAVKASAECYHSRRNPQRTMTKPRRDKFSPTLCFLLLTFLPFHPLDQTFRGETTGRARP